MVKRGALALSAALWLTSAQVARAQVASVQAASAALPSSSSASAPTPRPEASALEALLSALRKSATFTARGQTSVTVAFPPRPQPLRSAQQLPPVRFIPTLIRRNFVVTAAAPEQVAGRLCWMYTLTPRAGHASRWRLWIDTRWNVPLAYEELAADGLLARRAELVQARALSKRRAPLSLVPAPALTLALNSSLPGLRLPAGFSAVGASWRTAGGLSEPQLTLSDGVNVLALVISARNVKAAPGVAVKQVGQTYVWLVGNLPQSDLSTALGPVLHSDPAPLGTFLPPAPSNP